MLLEIPLVLAQERKALAHKFLLLEFLLWLDSE